MRGLVMSRTMTQSQWLTGPDEYLSLISDRRSGMESPKNRRVADDSYRCANLYAVGRAHRTGCLMPRLPSTAPTRMSAIPCPNTGRECCNDCKDDRRFVRPTRALAVML